MPGPVDQRRLQFDIHVQRIDDVGYDDARLGLLFAVASTAFGDQQENVLGVLRHGIDRDVFIQTDDRQAFSKVMNEGFVAHGANVRFGNSLQP